jgi:peptide/nickel transport system permease protein
LGTYIVRRLIAMALMLVALSVSVFLIFAVLPTNPARLTCGKTCTPDIIKANEIRLGLNKPVYKQYEAFVGGIFAGRTYGSGTAAFPCPAPCLGYSFVQNAPVDTLLRQKLPVTIQLALGGFVLWMVSGILSGIAAALKRGTWIDRGLMSASMIGYSFPPFFIALLLVFFITIKFGFPAEGYVPFGYSPWLWFQGMVLPWVAIALLYGAFYTRLTRNQMLETLGEDYIRTARAKGLPERTVIGRHALRAGLTPIVTSAGLDLAGLLGGSIVIEQVFNLDGIGKQAVASVITSDLPVITATVLVAAVFVIVANLVVDILYVAIDPRVRLT